MAITYINTGTIANDGTGDDLREAFIKVNDNFEELDLRIVEETVIVNSGTIGTPLYAGKLEGEHRIKRLQPGTNITFGTAENTITINAADSLDQLLVTSDNGSITVERGQVLNVRGGEVISTRTDGQTIYLDLDNTGILARDSSPQLTTDLDSNNHNITGVNSIQANIFNGALEGLVYGFDMRQFGSFFDGFDFGEVRSQYTSALQFIINRVDVDFGDMAFDSGDTVDLGFI